MTVFYELQGDEARAQLEALALTLKTSGAQTELLESADQGGLFLLVCRCTEGTAQPNALADAKIWQFRTVP